MEKYRITYRNDRGQTDVTYCTSANPTSEQAVISAFIARTGYRVICCERVY